VSIPLWIECEELWNKRQITNNNSALRSAGFRIELMSSMTENQQNSWREHVAPTLHNAIGTILASMIAATALAFISPVRKWLQTTMVPIWVVLFALFVFCVAYWLTVRFFRRELRKFVERSRKTQGLVAQLGDTMNAAAEAREKAKAAEPVLDPIELRILNLLIKTGLTERELEQRIGILPVKARYFIKRLEDRKYISSERYTNPKIYRLTHEGTEFLIKKGVI